MCNWGLVNPQNLAHLTVHSFEEASIKFHMNAMGFCQQVNNSKVISQVTSMGFALDMSTHEDAAGDTKINMLDTKYKEDMGPLIEGCACFSCRHHTRAYVHHLLLVHEMTAQILLELHNTHQMLEWFAGIQASIAKGTFQKLKQSFIRRREVLKLGK